VGLALRLILVRGIWVDEAISVHQAHLALPSLIQDLRQTDNHPPLYFVLLWGTTHVLGFSELGVHAPSIIAGTLLIPALFLTGRAMFDRRTGLIAAGLATVAPLAVWYSQEARMYSLFMLLATLAVWAQVRVLRDGGLRYWLAYGALTIALLYTHYFSVIPIGVQQLAFAVAVFARARRGQPVRGLLIGCWLTWLALVVAVAPLAPFVAEQFAHDQTAGTGFANVPAAGAPATPQGSSVSVYAVLSNFVWALWGYHADGTMLHIAALWPLLMLLTLGLLGRNRSPQALLALALVVIPMAVLLVVGLKKRDLFEVRYFSGAVPLILLLSARAVSSVSLRRGPVVVATAALFATVIAGCADQQLTPNNPRDYDFRGALGVIKRESRPGDVVLYTPDYLRDVISYYTPNLHAHVLAGPNPSVPGRGGVFLLASFLEAPGKAAMVGSASYALAHDGRHRLVATNTREKIYIWEYR
jgi:4-amino-4-deoxy-L-arabinose transferase-like glycosyltransferase